MDQKVLGEQVALAILRGDYDVNMRNRTVSVTLSYEVVNSLLSAAKLPGLHVMRAAVAAKEPDEKAA